MTTVEACETIAEGRETIAKACETIKEACEMIAEGCETIAEACEKTSTGFPKTGFTGTPQTSRHDRRRSLHDRDICKCTFHKPAKHAAGCHGHGSAWP